MKYILTGKYANGDDYADKCYSIEDLLSELADIAKDEKSTTIADDAKVRTDQISVTTEEQ